MSSEVAEFFELTRDDVERLGQKAVVHIGWWNNVSHSERHDHQLRYIQLYLEACLRDLQWFIGQTGYSDDEVLPILWRCCHTVELALKASIELKLRLLDRGIPSDVPNTHCLEALLKKHVELFESPFPFTAGTNKFLLKLDEMNARQQNRYPFAKSNNKVAWTDQVLLSMAIFDKEFQYHGGQIIQYAHDLARELDQKQAT